MLQNQELSASKFDFADDLTQDIHHLAKKHKVPNFLVNARDNDLILPKDKARQKMKRLTLRKRSTKYSFDSDESDFELPQNEQHMVVKLKDNDYLKLYQMKNPMHDSDRECARSIMYNLKMPDEQTMKFNPYLNKTPAKEPMLNLHTQELFSMAQITLEKKLKYKNYYEDEIIAEENLEIENKKQKQLKNFQNNYIDRENSSSRKKQDLQSIIDEQIKYRMLLQYQKVTERPGNSKNKKKMPLSNLSREILMIPQHKLKGKFLQKNKELELFMPGGNLHKYDTNTLVSEMDKERLIKNSPEILQSVLERDYSDPLIRYNISKEFLDPQVRRHRSVSVDEQQQNNSKGMACDVGVFIQDSKNSFMKLQLKTLDQNKHKKGRSMLLLPGLNPHELNHSRNKQIHPYGDYTHNKNKSQEIQKQLFQSNMKINQNIRKTSQKQYDILQKYKRKLDQCDKLIDKHDVYINRVESTQLLVNRFTSNNEEKPPNFEMYEKLFQIKEKAWTQNEIRKIDTDYQRKLHIALTQKKSIEQQF
ncbi:UNKNOWN [Stylonychia lemnae]|uniref:Uncharacterized protein n=1 Tax=Stylonychia lemnae TaxID=5949 RepID=A0A078ASX2_STYLE|nr:UNKNOWN [Stylonychia lemnae]|eukprot:CDW85121.1 UNKNOWN [Stylonychia lemnae]